MLCIKNTDLTRYIKMKTMKIRKNENKQEKKKIKQTKISNNSKKKSMLSDINQKEMETQIILQ